MPHCSSISIPQLLRSFPPTCCIYQLGYPHISFQFLSSREKMSTSYHHQIGREPPIPSPVLSIPVGPTSLPGYQASTAWESMNRILCRFTDAPVDHILIIPSPYFFFLLCTYGSSSSLHCISAFLLLSIFWVLSDNTFQIPQESILLPFRRPPLPQIIVLGSRYWISALHGLLSCGFFWRHVYGRHIPGIDACVIHAGQIRLTEWDKNPAPAPAYIRSEIFPPFDGILHVVEPVGRHQTGNQTRSLEISG